MRYVRVHLRVCAHARLGARARTGVRVNSLLTKHGRIVNLMTFKYCFLIVIRHHDNFEEYTGKILRAIWSI